MSNPLFKDWKKAIWKAPLHILLSVPVAALSLPIPPIGKAYVKWRAKSEADDASAGRDTPEKAAIDFYSQTALVNRVLSVWRIK